MFADPATSVATLDHERLGTSGATFPWRVGHPARPSPPGRRRADALPPAVPHGRTLRVPGRGRGGAAAHPESWPRPAAARPLPFPARPARHVAAAAGTGAAGSRGARSMRGARSGQGAAPAQWVLIAPGNPAGPLRRGAALQQRPALLPRRPARAGGGRSSPGPGAGAGAAAGGRAPPGCARPLWDTASARGPARYPPSPLQGPRFPRSISAFNLCLSLGFCQGLLPPMSLMGSGCPLARAGGPPCLHPLSSFLQILKETV